MNESALEQKIYVINYLYVNPITNGTFILQDGILSASDLKAAFASVGRSISDGEASGMVGEAPGPVNFTQMVILFAEKMAGGKSDFITIFKKLSQCLKMNYVMSFCSITLIINKYLFENACLL